MSDSHREWALQKALAYADDIIATLREPFVVLDGDLRVKTANRAFYDSFQAAKEETENRLLYCRFTLVTFACRNLKPL